MPDEHVDAWIARSINTREGFTVHASNRNADRCKRSR
jgi:hypothetical protein